MQVTKIEHNKKTNNLMTCKREIYEINKNTFVRIYFLNLTEILFNNLIAVKDFGKMLNAR